MAEATVTFHVDESLAAEFSRAAEARDSTGAQLLREYMRTVVEQERNGADYDAWFRREVQIGIEAAEAGDVLDADSVEAEAAAWRAAARLRLPDTAP